MANSDLIFFFENADSLTSFERKKKIYELTNDLDIDLLNDLKTEVDRFFINKIKEEKFKTIQDNSKNDDNTIPNSLFGTEFIDFENNYELYNKFAAKPSLNHFINMVFAQYNENFLNDIIEKTSDLIYDLNELIRRGEKLAKNTKSINNNKNEESIDYSDNTYVDRIIYMELLGIIDFLRSKKPFNTKKNRLASVLSAITGAPLTSIQPVMYATINKDVDNKNYAFYSEKSVNNVIKSLIEIEYNPKQQE